MEKFKKGDMAYIVDNSIIVPCQILKIAKEDKIKDHTKIGTYKKSHWKIMDGMEVPSWYPQKMAFIKYINSGREEWTEIDRIKKDPKDFIIFINQI